MDKTMQDSWPRVSIIMPALNEAKHLSEVFDGLEHLDYPKDRIEIILIDNGSKDGTDSIGRRRGAIVIEAPHENVGQLRNLGAERATGDILAFVDSDCIVDSEWLKNAIPYLNAESVGAMGCHTRIPEDSSWVERTLDFHANREGVNEVEYLPTANLIVKKEVFNRVGGFNPDLRTGEDSDFCHKVRALKSRLISDTNIRAVHLGYPKTLRQLYRKEKWHSSELFNLLLSTNLRFEYVTAIGVPVLYLMMLVLAFGLAIRSIFGKDILLLLYSGFCVVSVPALLAVYKMITKRCCKYFFYSVIYFSVVLVARISAIARYLLGG